MMHGVLLVLAAALLLDTVESQPVPDQLPGELKEMVKAAKIKMDMEFKFTREEMTGRIQRDPSVLSNALLHMKQPVGSSRTAVRFADIAAISISMAMANKETDKISEKDMDLILDLSGCSAKTRPLPSCPRKSTFRTPSGVCNNRKNPFLGSSNTAFVRWLPAEYQDGFSKPRGWFRRRRRFKCILPLARRVSNRVLSTANEDVESDSVYSHLLTIFAQWTDHDLTFTPLSAVIRAFEDGEQCDETCERKEPCFPIKIPRRDPRRRDPAFRNTENQCIPFIRSAAGCGFGNNASMLAVRQQMNAITAFIDAGQVYGSDGVKVNDLRNFTSDRGLLRVNGRFRDDRRELLPFSTVTANMCATRRQITNVRNAEEVPCFVAGDERSNENIGLTSLHTLMLREHNRLARALGSLNPKWRGERIYQETRKIMGAYLQVITIRDYLPHIVGELPAYPGYDEKVDPSISNVFATAAYRFAHLNIQPFMFRLDQWYRQHRQFTSPLLHRAFFTPWRLVFEGGIDPILRGLMGRPAKLGTQDEMMHDELRDRLFEISERLALDLASLNLQRGRDHGLPSYTKWRRLCGLWEPRTLLDLIDLLGNRRLARKLYSLYGGTDEIDVWIGGVSEPFIPGTRTGPLFACLIGTQFQNIRQGDRLWWENPGVFTPKQRHALQQTELARIICDNTGITELPAKPFLNTPRGEFTKCTDIPEFNLQPWKDGAKGFCNDSPEDLD